MATVYSAEEGSSLLQTNAETSPSENQEDVAQEQSTTSESSERGLSLENVAVDQELPPGGPAEEAREHEEPELDEEEVAVPIIKIKEEQIEDNEYITVSLNVAGEDSDEQAVRNADLSDRDESMDGDWPFRCEDCSEAFGDEEAYLEHRREHTHDGPIVCLDADSQWDDLLVSTDGGRRTLCCALCGCTFSSSRGFLTHQLKHRNQDPKQQAISDTGQSSTKEKHFGCKDCGKMFASVGQCLDHQRSHKQPANSILHEMDHLKKKPFECHTCGRCYSRATALEAHQRCHEVKLVKVEKTEKMISDDQVPAQTENATDATSEPVEESEKKLFECLCGKSFRTLCGLGTHQRFSTTCSEVGKVKVEPKRPFDCSECGKSFVSPLALSCHQHWHKRRARLHGGGQTFTCKECGRVFTSLTFYNKHQRLAHSNEMAAKSFLNQVVQLQKKAFECEECGLRFSRASALQSHQLCHTDAFSDILENSSKAHPAGQTPGPHQSKQDKAEHFAVGAVAYSQDAARAAVLENELSSDEADGAEDRVTSYNGFEIVSVTESSDSGSDCDSAEDLNPDLELVCESDQEEKEDYSFDLSQEAEAASSEPANPEMNVKIVQIGYEHFKGGLSVNTEMDRSPPQEGKKYDCPHCDRTFAKAVALRCHVLWHRGAMGKKSRFRRNVGRNPVRRVKCEICGHESFSKAAHYFHLGKHEDRQPYKSITYQLANLQKNSFKCDICGMHFSRLSALNSHQQHHDLLKKPYACLQCNKSYANPSGLYSHRKVCCGKDGQEKKPEHFNPTKTLLGPKVHHCKKCGKGFWSMGAFIHHKQYQPQCAGIGPASSEGPRQPESGRVRRKRRGRKRGVVSRNVDTESKEEHKCEVCGKSYRMLGCFLKHQLIHDASNNLPPVKSFDYQVEQLKKNSYSCPDCGKLFSRAMALQFHMKCHGYETGLPIETPTPPHSSNAPQCQNCLAFFACESALEIHLKHCAKPKTEPAKRVEESQRNELETLNVVQENDARAQKRTSRTEKEAASEAVRADLKYKCGDCGRGFSVVGALNFHRRIHSEGHRFKSSGWQNVAQEKFKEQVAKFPFICPECGRNFSTNAALGTHRRWHKDKRMARCFSKNNNMSRKSKDVGNYLCNLCGKRFFYLCVLRRHQKYHPPMKARPDAESKHKTSEIQNLSPESVLACPEEKSLLASRHANPSDAAEDAENQEQESPFSVQVSGHPTKSLYDDLSSTFAVFPTKGDKLKIKYQCTLCRKSFSNMRGLRAHKWQKHRRVRGRPPASTDVSTKPLACSGCSRRYSSLGALFNHERSCRAYAELQKPPLKPVKPHVAEGPASPHQTLESTAKCLYKCHKCGKAFPSEAQLEAHKEAARTRPHSCALCCRGYWTESQLQQHLAWHDEVRRRLPTELRYRLNTSSASGLSSAKLQAAAFPSGANPSSLVRPAPTKTTANAQSCKSHRCPHCGETFSSPHALQQHRAVHKNEEPYRCSLCPQTFGEIRDLIDHHQECLGDKELRDSSLSAPARDDESLTCIECGTSFDQETDLHQHYIEHARGVC